MESLLYGRELLKTELPKDLILAIQNEEIKIKQKSSFIEKNKKKYCRRCKHLMTEVKESRCICQKNCAYCRNCLQMGKVRACEMFYSYPEVNDFPTYTQNKLLWEGTLSEQQALASKRIVKAMKGKETLLLWAVTGAGKTEMLFAGIEYALRRKKRVCIATPRVDVARELAPRILEAFPKTDLMLLHGEMETPYEYTQLVIGTTHQLYRFKEAFDVVIIDEIDAFPFHLDDSLKYAAEKARKKESTLIYLSATPDEKLRREVKKNKLEAVILPARYHGHSLPVPQIQRCKDWQESILKKMKYTTFGRQFEKYIAEGKRFLIFAPNISWMLALEKILRKKKAHLSFATVYAGDPERSEKIMKMRRDEVQFLITTTILERGVTFPNINVLVIGAEDRTFTEAALVQIAGRCGRSAAYPSGEVIFFHDGQTLAMKKARRQIQHMNALAQKRGLLHG